MKPYTSEELYNMKEPERPKEFDLFPLHSEPLKCKPLLYDGLWKNGFICGNIYNIHYLCYLYQLVCEYLDQEVERKINIYYSRCLKQKNIKPNILDTKHEYVNPQKRLPIIREYFERLFVYHTVQYLKERCMFISEEEYAEKQQIIVDEWNNKSFIEKKLILNKNLIKPKYLRDGWIFYLIVMIFAIILHGTIAIWVFATLVFFIWRKREIDKFN